MKFTLWFRILLVYFLITFLLCVSLVATLAGLLNRKGILTEDLLYEIIGQSVGVFFLGFFIAFVISIAYNRRLIRAIRNLKDASERVRDGDFDVRLPVDTKDELADVEEAFNLMVQSLKSKTEALKTKELYVNTMMDALWVVDENNVIIDVNPAFTKLFGYTHEEAMGCSMFDFIDEADWLSVREELQRRHDERIFSTYRAHIMSKDGRRIPVLITGAPIVEEGKVIAKIGIIKDISDHEKLLSEIKASKEHMESIIDAISDALVVIDKNYRIVQANRVARQRYGHDVVGALCYEILHQNPIPCWKKGFECPVEKAISDTGALETLHIHTTKKMEQVYEEIISSPITNKLGEVTFIVEVLRDVTEKVKKEKLLQQRTRQQQLINSIVSICTTSLKAEEVFSRVLDRLVDEFGMDGGGFFFVDERRKNLYCRFHKGISEDFVRKAGVIKIGEDIPGRVALTGEPIFSSDISKDPRIKRAAVKDAGLKGYCCLPMKGKGVVSGVFCLFTYRERVFSPEEQEVLQAIGEMTGLALENIRFYERLRALYEDQRLRQSREQETLQKMASSLSTATNLNDVIRAGCSVMEEYLYADAVLFFEVGDYEKLRLKYSKNISLDKNEYNFSELSIDKDSIEKNGFVTKLLEDSTFVSGTYHDRTFRMAFCMTAGTSSEILGVIIFLFSMQRDIPQEERHFLTILKGIFSVSYERSIFYERMMIERGLAEVTLNSIKDGVFTLDLAGRIVSANRALTAITGKSVANIMGKHYSEVFEPLKDVRAIDKALKGSNPEPEVLETRDGGPVYQLVVSPLIEPSDTLYGAVCVLRDITKDREIDRMKTEIIRSVSHEFRTPLSAIIGMTEMVLEGDVSGQKAEAYLKTVIKEGKRLAAMVSDLLDISKLESGTIMPKFEEVDLEGLIKSVLDRFHLKIKEKKAIVSIKVDDDVKSIFTEREMLFKVLANLIDNSLKYSDPGCEIGVRANSGNSYVIITVEDTGWGIPSDELRHVGERFFRGIHGARTKGTGLGISLCKQMLNQIGGTLEIESVYGKGTAVKIILKKITPGGQ